MNLSESIALKAAGNKPQSGLASKVQTIRNKQAKVTPGKPSGSASVDKTTAQF